MALPASRAFGAARSGHAVLVDLRSADEWLGVAPLHSTHVPIEELPEHLVGLEAQERPVVFLCADGALSGLMADLAAVRGRLTATSVEGGLQAWFAQSLPVRVAPWRG